MNLRVYDADADAQISYWGVSDFEVSSDTITVFWPITADRESEEQIRGRVLSAIDSKSLNARGLKESIETDRNRDDHIVIEPSGDFPELHEVVDGDE